MGVCPMALVVTVTWSPEVILTSIGSFGTGLPYLSNSVKPKVKTPVPTLTVGIAGGTAAGETVAVIDLGELIMVSIKNDLLTQILNSIHFDDSLPGFCPELDWYTDVSIRIGLSTIRMTVSNKTAIIRQGASHRKSDCVITSPIIQ